MSVSIHEFQSQTKSEFPDLWNSLHPRSYKAPCGWCPPSVPASVFCLHSLKALDRRPDWSNSDTRSAVVIQSCVLAAQLVRLRVPTYHVSRDLLDAVSKSDPLKGLNWLDADLPHEAGVFLLPGMASYFPNWLAWCRVQEGQSYQIPGTWGVMQPLVVPRSTFMVAAGSGATMDFEQFIISKPDGNFDGDMEVVIEDDDLTLRPSVCVTLLLNLLLAISMRPELVERDGKRVRTIKNGPAREEWTPNWIGRTYRVQRADGDGTHASPRLHWRRGHYRRQPCGTGRKEHKIIWLEPCLVGGGDADG